ncbi:FecCD family ABC transporter permease [Gordonia malaquae]|uniref:FecCD family ABC transporter permease n=1 Tax=Gordonia malaquae TaxID=410332 RepID=UPI003BF88CFD
MGSRYIAPDEVWRLLWNPDVSQDARVIHDLRVPRTVLGVVAGAALGVARALIMALTRNPLADPGILGVNVGAHLAVALAIAGFWHDVLYPVCVVRVRRCHRGCGGGFCDWLGRQSWAVASSSDASGRSLRAVLSDIATGVTVLDQRTFDLLRDWNAGSIVNRDLSLTMQLIPFVLAGLVIAVALARPLNAIALGEDMARSFGTNAIHRPLAARDLDRSLSR